MRSRTSTILASSAPRTHVQRPDFRSGWLFFCAAARWLETCTTMCRYSSGRRIMYKTAGSRICHTHTIQKVGRIIIRIVHSIVTYTLLTSQCTSMRLLPRHLSILIHFYTPNTLLCSQYTSLFQRQVYASSILLYTQHTLMLPIHIFIPNTHL